MSGYRNVTFDEIEVGASASAKRMLTQTEIEALVLVSGDIVPFHLDANGLSDPDDICVDAVAAEAIISGRLERRLPGPGTRIVSRQFRFGSWVPDVTLRAEDGTDLFLWTVPPR